MNTYVVKPEITNVINLPMNESMEMEVQINDNLLQKTINSKDIVSTTMYSESDETSASLQQNIDNCINEIDNSMDISVHNTVFDESDTLEHITMDKDDTEWLPKSHHIKSLKRTKASVVTSSKKFKNSNIPCSSSVPQSTNSDSSDDEDNLYSKIDSQKLYHLNDFSTYEANEKI